jgi:hypothetical protein
MYKFIVCQLAFAVPSTDSAAMVEDFMPIRITHRDKNRMSMQHADMVKLTTDGSHALQASYRGGARIRGILCECI